MLYNNKFSKLLLTSIIYSFCIISIHAYTVAPVCVQDEPKKDLVNRTMKAPPEPPYDKDPKNK